MKVAPAFIVMSQKSKVRIILSDVNFDLKKRNLSIKLVPLEYNRGDYRFYFHSAFILSDFNLYQEADKHVLTFSVTNSFLEKHPVFGISLNFSFSNKSLGAIENVIVPVVYLPALGKQEGSSEADFKASVEYNGPLLLRKKDLDFKINISGGSKATSAKIVLQKITSSGLVPLDVGYIDFILPGASVYDLKVAPETSVSLGLNKYVLTCEALPFNGGTPQLKKYDLLVIYIPWYIMLLGTIAIIILLSNLIKLLRGGYGKNKGQSKETGKFPEAG